MIDILLFMSCMIINITLIMFIGKIWKLINLKEKIIGGVAYILWINLHYMLLSQHYWNKEYTLEYWTGMPILTFVVISYLFWDMEKNIKARYPENEKELDVVIDMKKYCICIWGTLIIYNVIVG